jgi:hypothetical protein
MKSQFTILRLAIICTVTIAIYSCDSKARQVSTQQVAEVKATKDSTTKSCCTGKTPPRFYAPGVPGDKKAGTLYTTKSK